MASRLLCLLLAAAPLCASSARARWQQQQLQLVSLNATVPAPASRVQTKWPDLPAMPNVLQNALDMLHKVTGQPVAQSQPAPLTALETDVSALTSAAGSDNASAATNVSVSTNNSASTAVNASALTNVSASANNSVSTNVSSSTNVSAATSVSGSTNAPASSNVSGSTTLGKQACNLFTLWEYEHGAPLYSRVNVESWRRHSHGLCNEPILIDDSNVKTYVPDMPDEYFRLPYHAAKSDVIRYALLYHNGGIYMDTDFLVVKDLDKVIELAETQDLVSYAEGGPKTWNTCDAWFSSNFMAGKKGSAFHKEVWERQKKLMTSHCQSDEEKLEKVCCFDDAKMQCHIPWAGIGEGVSHEVIRNWQGPSFASTCLQREESFTPEEWGSILEHTPNLQEALKHWAEHGVPNPTGRIAYHLFNSMHNWASFNCDQLFDNSTVVGSLFVSSFTTGHGTNTLAGGADPAGFLANHGDFKDISSHPGIPCK